MKEVFDLWDNPPLFNGKQRPTIEYFRAENKKGDGALVIFAGGGYKFRTDHEGKAYAEYFSSQGIDCFVVQYRVYPDLFPRQLLDGRRAVRFVKANAKRFGISPDKIAVMGSSAGGHLAALLSTYSEPIDGEGVDEIDKFDCRVSGQILCYPVTDFEWHVGSFNNIFGCTATKETADTITPTLLCDETTPPLFLWHTAEDLAVDLNGSLRYAMKLHQLNVPVEMHIYPYGRHGLSLSQECPHITGWPALLISWLKLHCFLNENEA